MTDSGDDVAKQSAAVAAIAKNWPPIDNVIGAEAAHCPESGSSRPLLLHCFILRVTLSSPRVAAARRDRACQSTSPDQE
jgi:hypothetical protein